MSYSAEPKKPITLSTLLKYKAQNEKFSCLTCYDASFAHLMQKANIDVILVGDSLGMVVQGHASTLPVTVEDMAYHTANIARSNSYALIMCDLPFMSYATSNDAILSTQKVMQAGANMIKIEGSRNLASTVETLANHGVPSCVHLGLTPQSVNIFGGYKVQGKNQEAADKLLEDCRILTDSGAAMILLECVPFDLAKTVTQTFNVPVIGIGAGVETDGQVLVMHDMLGVYTRKPAKFVKNFLTDTSNQTSDILGAFSAYHQAVKTASFPAHEHTFY